MARLAGRFRRFRATAIGEFVAALVLFIVIGASFVPLLFTAGPTSALAVDAIWLNAPISANWNSGTNWSTGIAPVNPGDTATFNTSSQTFPTLSDLVFIESITFNPGASAFTINTGFQQVLILQGTGIVNSSGTEQTISNNTVTSFQQGATAANVTIINNDGAILAGGAGFTEFIDTSTADSARITNEGAAASGTSGGTTQFSGTSRAGSARITNEGAAASGTFAAFTVFAGTSTADSATIINNGGTGGGAGGFTLFSENSDGGTARAMTSGNGRFDISGLTTGGMGIGSIEGSGNYFLGSKNLSVGGNNLNTMVSGIIQDGGFFGGIGGSLTKVGTGTLTLTGANAYSGGTNLNGGILAVQSDANLGTGPLSFNGGTLEALAAGGGIDSSKAITLDAGGGTFLADADTSSILRGAITGVGAWTKAGPGVLTLSGDNSYGGATLVSAGTLQLGNGGTSGSILGDVLNNGILAFNRSDSFTFNGLISGAGSVQQNGTGTTVLVADNTYLGGTTINAGTLQLGNGGTTGSIIGNVLDNAILAFNRSDFVTFDGLISGNGSVQQNGIGTTVLVANNTYSGGTIISAGTLQLGNGGTTGSIIGNVVDDGILAFNRSDFVTFDGLISGNGSVQQNGIGTTVLVGDNTYTGGTIINAGILQLGNGGTSGSIVGDILNHGVLAFNRSDFVTFDGLISGTGALAKLGSGTLRLVNSNLYRGGTTIAAGTILTQNASALGTGPVSFGNGARLEVQDLLNLNGNWTVFPGVATVGGGTVQTFGDFNLGGGGTLIANATFSVPGAANLDSSGFVVNSGFTVSDNVNLSGNSTAVINGVLTSPSVNVKDASSLIVNDPGIVAANVNVEPSAFLALLGTINGSVMNSGFFQGIGAVNGNLVNSGIVSPGSSPGKLTIGGNYTQNATGTLHIEVAGTGSSQHDLLALNGRASLAGTLQLVRVGGFNLSPGDQVTFLTANDGVSGTFDTVQNDFVATGTIVQGEVVYLPNSVVLEATQGSFASLATSGLPPNSVAVANALDSAAGDPRAAALFAFLNTLPLSQLPAALVQLAPEELTSVNVVTVSTANVQGSNLAQRMGEIHAGSSGFSSSGFAITGNTPSFGGGFAGVSGPEGKSGPPVFAPIPDNRWGVFITGIGEFTNVSSTFDAPGYDLATGGFTLGVDYRVLPNFAIGLTGGYAYTGVSLANDGRIRVNGGKLGIYSTVFGSGFYLDAAVTGGLNGYKTRRTGLEGSANGSTVGGDLNVFIAGGYDWKKGGLSIGPTASFQYSLVGFDDFTESGSLAPLAYPAQNSNSFRSAFGMKASYDWKVGPIRLIPQVRAAWQHEYGTTDYSIVASFASGAGDSFTVIGPEIGRDSLLVSAGFAIQWNDRITTYAYYDGEFFRTNYLSNNISAGVRVGF